MATVIVQSDHDDSTLMQETVLPVHLASEQSSLQFLERLAWAIEDRGGRRRSDRDDLRRRVEATRRERSRLPASVDTVNSAR